MCTLGMRTDTFCVSHTSVFKQGGKGERGPMGVPGAQGLSGTKGDKVSLCTRASRTFVHHCIFCIYTYIE